MGTVGEARHGPGCYDHRPLIERRRPPVDTLVSRRGNGQPPAGRGDPGSAGRMAARRSRRISPEPAPRGARCRRRPTPTARTSAQDRRHRRHQARLDGADAAVLTEYRGLEGQRARRPARRAATRGDRLQDLQEHAGQAGPRGGRASRSCPTARGPGCDRVRRDGDAVIAAKALRDFAGANPNLVLKGGLLGDRVLDAARHRGPRRRAAPRRAARPARRRVPGADGEGGRPVPGVHPQHGLRAQGARRPAGRGGESCPRRGRSWTGASCETRRRSRRSAADIRPRRECRPKPTKHRPEPPTEAAEADAEASQPETTESNRRTNHGNHEHRPNCSTSSRT